LKSWRVVAGWPAICSCVVSRMPISLTNEQVLTSLKPACPYLRGETNVPPEDGEIDALTHHWVNELARAAGLQVWQDLAN